jgi:hypothetical protein
MVIKEEIAINAPLPIVWSVFSCLEDWKSWNSVCRSSSFLEGSELSGGACISFVIHPFFGLPIRISPHIVKCEPGKEVVWKGARLGIHAKHQFTFHEENGGVRLVSAEEFHGLVSLMSTFIFLPSRLHRLTKKLLNSIKNESEARFLMEKSR